MVIQSVPNTMVTNRVYDVSVMMKNTGTLKWTSSGAYRLGVIGGDYWGIGRVELPYSTVGTDSTPTFKFQVRAPSIPGTYTFQWRMVQDGVEWFGVPTTAETVTVRDPINNAEYVSHSIPGQARTGQRQQLEVTMRNNGDLPWTRAQQYTLMSQNPDNNVTWGLNRVPLPVETVNPGESATFRFDVTAPAAVGWSVSQWGMQREGHGAFGASGGAWVDVTEPVNNAQPTGQDAPTQMETGRPYNVSVTVLNNGESTWTRDKQYTLMAQSPHNNMTWGVSRVALPVDNIAPGQSATFNFQVTAPSNSGSYAMQWGMQREGYGSFGPGTTPVTINVVAPPPLVNKVRNGVRSDIWTRPLP
jgi:hypothetical protein